MFKKLNIPILGIVQNMSVMKCTKCYHENHIFGNRVQKLAKQESIYLFYS
jgi:ATP-binding protein involved in chromosome partitioning